MSLRKECDVRNPLYNQPRLIETKRTWAVQCANPQCSKELLYLREGRIELLELESHADDQFPQDDGAFAMNCLPSKYFWLCGECAETIHPKAMDNLRSRLGAAQPQHGGQRFSSRRRNGGDTFPPSRTSNPGALKTG